LTSATLRSRRFHFRDPLRRDSAGVASPHDAIGAKKVRMTSVAPSINGDCIEQSCIRIGLGKSSRY
jgi:hypothetical protein